jgi:hypothetical protein
MQQVRGLLVAFTESAMFPSSALSLLTRIRRNALRCGRASLHVTALVAGLLSSGVVPAGLLSGPNEAETAQQEGLGSEFVELTCDARHQLRRPSLVRHERCTLSTLLPAIARRPADSSIYPLALVRLSSGLAVPLRC